jgi:hypothetical protein
MNKDRTIQFLLILLWLSICGVTPSRSEEQPIPATNTPLPTPSALWQSQSLQQTPRPDLDIDGIAQGNPYYVYWGPNVPNLPYYIYRATNPDFFWASITPTPVYVQIQASPQKGFFYFQEPNNTQPGKYHYRVWALGAGVTTDDYGNEPPEWKNGIQVMTNTPTLTPTPLPTPEAIWQFPHLNVMNDEDVDEIVVGRSFSVHWGPNVPEAPYEIYRKEGSGGNYELISSCCGKES